MPASLLPPDAESVLLITKTWEDIRDYLATSDLVLVPIGAIEQHGPSCPLMTDALIAEYLACCVGLHEGVLVAPTIPFGDSLLQLAFPGTIALRPSTLLQVIKDYIGSLYRHGFRRILVINGHGDNRGIIQAAFSELGDELDNLRYNFQDFWDFPAFRTIMKREFDDDVGGHADATDAALLLAIAPQFVKSDRFASDRIKVKYWVSRNLVHDLYSTSGVMNADQRLASRPIGEELIAVAIECYREMLNDLRK